MEGTSAWPRWEQKRGRGSTPTAGTQRIKGADKPFRPGPFLPCLGGAKVHVKKDYGTLPTKLPERFRSQQNTQGLSVHLREQPWRTLYRERACTEREPLYLEVRTVTEQR